MTKYHVAITGASSGIGEAIAREFAASGASLTLVARRAELLHQLADSLSAPTAVFTADLRDVEHSDSWIAAAEEKLGPIDVLINNAGIQILGPMERIAIKDGTDTMKLNLQTPIHLMHAVLPGMLKRGRGTIVNIASAAALGPIPGMFHYNASKAGLAAASEALRGELRGRGVNVLTVYPGVIPTALADNAVETYGGTANWLPAGTSSELAKRVRQAVDKKGARVIYPRTYAFARHFPALTRRLADRLTPSLAP